MRKFEKSTATDDHIEFYSNGLAIVHMKSPLTRIMHKITLPIVEEQWNKWFKDRKLIQDVFPDLTKEEREFLMTGYTPDDWERMFPPEDE